MLLSPCGQQETGDCTFVGSLDDSTVITGCVNIFLKMSQLRKTYCVEIDTLVTVRNRPLHVEATLETAAPQSCGCKRYCPPYNEKRYVIATHMASYVYLCLSTRLRPRIYVHVRHSLHTLVRVKLGGRSALVGECAWD